VDAVGFEDAEHLGYGVIEGLLAADYQAREFTGRQNVLKRHRPYGGVVLLENAFPGSTPLGNVALQPAAQTFFIARGDEHRQIQKFAHFPMMQRENSFDDEDGLRLDVARPWGTGVLIEEINRLLNGFATGESGQLRGEERPIESVGMIVVECAARFQRQMGLRMIISVKSDHF